MRKSFQHLILLAALFLIFPFSKGYSQQKSNPTLNEVTKKNVETVIHLLSYISRDYPNAVENGKVVDEGEYEEQLEFALQVQNLTKESKILPDNKQSVSNEIQKLHDYIAQKSAAEEISKTAEHIRSEIIAITGMETAPPTWPNLENGKSLFQATCAACHGVNGAGNGPAGKGLEPAPSNFLDPDLMNWVSPYQAYNTIKLGVPGTGMIAYENYTDQELWDLAFYVKSLRFTNSIQDSTALRKVFNQVYPTLNLKEVATETDKELLTKFDGDPMKLQAIRALSPTSENLKGSLIVARQKLKDAQTFYAAGNNSEARIAALSAYLEGIEPVEARLRSIDNSFVLDLESQMLRVRQTIEKNKPLPELEIEVQKALKIIDEAEGLLQGQKLNYWLTFILAWSIMLREGLEAVLVLAVVLLLIKNTGMKKALPWLHGGWISAVILGICGWFLSDYIIQFGGKNREIMEGIISLFAVAVLLFVGFWLHENSYAHQWQKFIKEKVGKYLQKDKMFGLAIFSFFVVFREAFEVILFLQAINLEASPQNKSAIGLGAVTAVIFILLLAYLFIKSSKRIPIRQLFLWSSWIVVLLAVILTGKGVHSLQESGWVSANSVASWIRVDWLGIYSTMETLLAQLAVIVLVVITYIFHNKKMKKQAG